MREFVQLVSTVEMTNSTNAKIDALVRFFELAPDEDKLWLIALFSGKRPRRPVKTSEMRTWAMEIAKIPEWLFIESYSAVGDLGETLALVLPQPTRQIEKSLATWMSELKELSKKESEAKRAYVTTAWSGLDQAHRLIFNKLIGGSFRIGISKKTLVNALAKYAQQDAHLIMHSIMGTWEVDQMSFEDLLSGTHIDYDKSKPYPFALAYALDKDLADIGDPLEWQVEYKWDGIRGQIVKRHEEVYIWSRGEELVTAQFPELVNIVKKLPQDFVIDGEILPLKDGSVLQFNDLQKRLNRKTVSKKLLEEVPVGYYAYDCLEINGEDIRTTSMSDRRVQLEALWEHIDDPLMKLSTMVQFEKWEELDPIRQHSRSINSEGLMLKKKASPYFVGRKKGEWWKWKVDPLTIDAVMIYAQRGSGRRSGYYTDYTFAVRTDEGLVTVAKAYSGLTKEEIQEVSRFVRANEIEKFGPVRTVKPELVFEIAFEGIALSKRHKSGVALRFPRISRWRRDKKVDEIDHIDDVKALISAS